MTRETLGTTLEEELEQAATRADIRAAETTKTRDGVRWLHLRSIHETQAARLRLRAARVREERERLGPVLVLEGQPQTTILQALFDRLCGPSLTPGTGGEG